MYIAQFLDFLRFEKKYSVYTVLSYQKDLNDFSKFLSNSNNTSEETKITHHLIRAFIVSLSEQHLSEKTINRKISALKSYFNYLQKGGKVAQNPVHKIANLKIKKSLPQFVDDKKMEQLLVKKAPSETQNWVSCRNNLIIELLYGTGIRLSELINLKVSQINIGNQSIKVLGKRNKERLVPLYPALLSEVTQFIELSKKTIENYGNLLFCLPNGKPLYPMLIYKLVKDSLVEVTTQKKRSPHVLRHSFATSMLNNGADLNAIKTILGHSSLAATQVYTHSNFEQLKSIYKQAHPKG